MIRSMMKPVIAIFLIAGISAENAQSFQSIDPFNIQSEIITKAYDLENVDERFKYLLVKCAEASYLHSPDTDMAFLYIDSLMAVDSERPEAFFLKAALYVAKYKFESRDAYFDSLKVYTEKTIEVTESLLKKNPGDPYLRFYLGAVYGNIGLFYLKQGSLWNAYTKGRKGKNYIEDVVEDYPDFADARMGLGLFQYYADILSPALKSLLFIVGLGGDREEGLKNIAIAAQDGQMAQVEAYYYLAKFLNENEGRPEKALNYIRRVLDKYPENYYFRYNYAELLYDNGHYLESIEYLENLMQNPMDEYVSFRKGLYFYYGKLMFLTGDYGKAVQYLFQSGASGRLTGEFEAERLYLAGLSLELFDRRSQALPVYKSALTFDEGLFKDRLERLIKKPLNKSQHDRYLIDSWLNTGNPGTSVGIDSLQTVNNGNSDQSFAEFCKLAECEWKIKNRDFTELYTMYSGINHKKLPKEKDIAARYYIAGLQIGMNSGNSELLEESISELDDIDTKLLSVPLQRKVTFYKRVVTGEVQN